MIDKLTVFSSINAAITNFEIAERNFGDLWDAGQARLTPDDVAQMAGLSARITELNATFTQHLSKFSQITNENVAHE